MTHHVFDRTALYDMVWAEPMRTLAGRLGISDVGLAHACRRAIIPTPPRGYWAKLAAGKTAAKAPLPKAKLAPDTVVIAPPAPKPPPSPRAQAVLDRIEPPQVSVAANLDRPHPIVRGWIKQNREAHGAHRRDGWGAPPADLQAPLEDRRLRLYGALFTALEAAKFKLEPGRVPDAEIKASKAGETIAFRLYERARQVRRPITAEEARWSWNEGKTTLPDRVSAGDLVLKIKTYTRGAMAEAYRDQKAPLETQLGKILVAFEAGVVELKAWSEERAAQAARWRLEEIARAKRAQHERDVKARREALMAEVGRWRQAQDLRAYVAAALASPAAQMVDYSAWSAWALKEAAALDPLGSSGPDLSFPHEPELEVSPPAARGGDEPGASNRCYAPTEEFDSLFCGSNHRA